MGIKNPIMIVDFRRPEIPSLDNDHLQVVVDLDGLYERFAVGNGVVQSAHSAWQESGEDQVVFVGIFPYREDHPLAMISHAFRRDRT